MSTVDYVKSLLDPFDTTFAQPKLFDGAVTRSSGLKFRSTGNITLDATGADNLIVLFPGLSNCMSWKIGSGSYQTHSVFPTHVGTPTDRQNLNRARLVSSALKISLLNSSDDNEGYWEAIRVPMEEFKGQALTLVDASAPVGEDYAVVPGSTFSVTNLSNYQTFQTGRLKDIHRFLFKLNSNSADHPFTSVKHQSAAVVATDCVDPYFDVVIIRIVGRIDAVTPSMIQYDLVSNQEIVYRDNTVMGRLATMNVMIPNLPVLLDRTKFILPSVQLA